MHVVATEAIAVDGVTTGYAKDLPVLHDVTLACDAGSTWGVIGPNASGKTTLLRVLSGALRPWKGRVTAGGVHVYGLGRKELSKTMAFVPQYLSVPVAFTVEEIVAMGRTPYVAGWSGLSTADRKATRAAMEQTDTAHLAHRTFDSLSGGERQRVTVALALAQEPDILFLDEPTAHLDIQHAWQLMEIVHEMNRSQGLTIVMTSHDINLAAAFCDRLLLLENGRVASAGVPLNVLQEDLLSRVYAHPLKVTSGEEGIWVRPTRTHCGPPA